MQVVNASAHIGQPRAVVDTERRLQLMAAKRLAKIVPGYTKPLHGPMALDAVGLHAVRASCPHFDAWLTQLEAI